jgi:hypothetical protein
MRRLLCSILAPGTRIFFLFTLSPLLPNRFKIQAAAAQIKGFSTLMPK